MTTKLSTLYQKFFTASINKQADELKALTEEILNEEHNHSLDAQKIGKGYWQSGYGRGFKKDTIVWLINGKAYIKNSNSQPYQTDLDGYVMVNKIADRFYEVGIITEHQIYNSNTCPVS